MPSARDLRRRIDSLGSTAQLTRALQMVAAARMRKAQQAVAAARPFAELLSRLQRRAATYASDVTHPLMATREVRRRAVVLIAPDKGLCGSLNTDVLRLAARVDPQTTLFITAGRKAAQFVARSRRQLVAEFAYGDSPTFVEARAIAICARDLFVNGDVDEVRVIATRFVNALTQTAATFEYLPIGRMAAVPVPGGLEPPTGCDAPAGDVTFTSRPEALLACLLAHSLDITIYILMLDAKASEHGARMVAMTQATESANELIAALRLEYYTLRQHTITRELLELTGGQPE